MPDRECTNYQADCEGAEKSTRSTLPVTFDKDKEAEQHPPSTHTTILSTTKYSNVLSSFGIDSLAINA
ncbi:unnamed protein product [Orchesella dallaii]|uniref:Uncharacterized protein n=1 Tax=Orchesella dallaii TaxID=48710 RepID=A0ABP1S1E5_9HEXA